MNLAGLVRHGVCRALAAPAYTRRLRTRWADGGKWRVHGQKLVQYIAACQNMSGVIIAVTLTGFIFLVTRATPSPSDDSVDGDEPRIALMGPFCLLFSFILGLASFIVFSVMSRIPKEALVGKEARQGEFFSWLSPFHLMSMVMFLSMALLAFGVYYVTRDWLSTPELDRTPLKSRRAVLGTAYTFALFGPVLVYFYFIITIGSIWRDALVEPFLPWGAAYAASAASMVFVFIGPVAAVLARGIKTPTRFMHATLISAFVFAGIQLAQNVLWEAHVMFKQLELSLVVIRTALAAFVVTVLFNFIRKDYHGPFGLGSEGE